jgi:hypothetical protein
MSLDDINNGIIIDANNYQIMIDKIKDLQQRLSLSQLENVKLREASQSVLKVIKESDMWWIDCPDRGGFDAIAIEEVLSTPPTLDDLYAWRDAEIAKALGEPVAYRREWEGDISDLNNYIYETDKNELDDNPNWESLYARKDNK